MARALRIAPVGHKTLDPIVVISLGNKWFCLDGHHRLRAYVAASIAEPVPVTVFEPGVSGASRINIAIRKGIELNLREKLPMTNDDRKNSAWRLCVLGGMSKQQLLVATGLSEGTIASMRRVAALLRTKEPATEELFKLSWRQAIIQSRDVPDRVEGDFNDRVQEMALELAFQLRKKFGLRLDSNPTVTARALEIYSFRLPRRLIWEWGPEHDMENGDDDEEGSDSP